jgi:deazaflavin-dependent oxidoreductase (nitroreductase family)
VTRTRDLLAPYLRGLKAFARTPAGTWYVRNVSRLVDAQLLRFTGGRVSTLYPLPAMLLTTIGAKSGQSRTHPLVYLVDDRALIVVGSNFGSTSQPAWYHNLLANPRVEVLAGTLSGSYTAFEITEPVERERAWALAVGTAQVWADYEARASNRTIPLIRLERLVSREP